MVFYGVLAIAVAAIAYWAVYSVLQGPYGVSVLLLHSGMGGLYPYNTTTFAVVVNNTGGRDISGMLVGFYVNGNAYKDYNVTVPRGQHATIMINYTYRQAGNYSFEAVADPAHLLSFGGGSVTYANASADVSNTTRPEPFSSIPGNGIVSSSVFDFYGTGLAAASVLGGAYDLAPAAPIFAPTKGVLGGVINNLYGAVVYAYGADAAYGNGSSAQAVWMLGTLAPSFVDQVISSYGLRESGLGAAEMFAVNGSSSICVSGSGGWTKVVEYTGQNGTCGSLGGYGGGEDGAYASEFAANTEFMNYTGRFIYTNSTILGTQFGMARGSRSSATWFVSRANGYTFVSSVGSGNQAANSTCWGLLSNGSICSTYVLPVANSSKASPYALIKTEELAGNYSFTLYSSVNTSSALDADYNAARLIEALDAAEKPVLWVSPYRNTCGFNATWLGCNVTAFGSQSNVASVRLYDRANASITINKAACFMTAQLQQNQTAGGSMSAGGYLGLNVTCRNIPLPAIGIQNSYYLYLNYTEGGRTSSIMGFLNTTNVV
jgi:hypothetical protein